MMTALHSFTKAESFEKSAQCFELDALVRRAPQNPIEQLGMGCLLKLYRKIPA